jgi:phenylacetate-CoA ligase
VRYRTASGAWLNNIEITHVLRPYPITQFGVHQDAGGVIHLRYVGNTVEINEVRKAVAAILGADTPLEVQRVDQIDHKIVQYTSSLNEILE